MRSVSHEKNTSVPFVCRCLGPVCSAGEGLEVLIGDKGIHRPRSHRADLDVQRFRAGPYGVLHKRCTPLRREPLHVGQNHDINSSGFTGDEEKKGVPRDGKGITGNGMIIDIMTKQETIFDILSESVKTINVVDISGKIIGDSHAGVDHRIRCKARPYRRDKKTPDRPKKGKTTNRDWRSTSAACYRRKQLQRDTRSKAKRKQIKTGCDRVPKTTDSRDTITSFGA